MDLINIDSSHLKQNSEPCIFNRLREIFLTPEDFHFIQTEQATGVHFSLFIFLEKNAHLRY